ncbi:hypothetical protein BGZ82_009554 [Podila clonocystis]|nr:hypothetical protein BGZ82_009554 [Podila clonocystis]
MLLKPVVTTLLIAVFVLAPVMAKKHDTDSEDTDSDNTSSEDTPSDDKSPCPHNPKPCPTTGTSMCIVDGQGKFARFLNHCEFERATKCGQVSTVLHTLYLCPDKPEDKTPPSASPVPQKASP